MRFGFKKSSLIIVGIFALGIIFMLLNTVENIFFYFSLVCFLAGFVLLSITSFKNIKLCKREQRETKIELLMEIATSEDGEQYVLKDSPFSRAEELERKRVLSNKIASFITCIAFVVVLVAILIKAIF